MFSRSNDFAANLLMSIAAGMLVALLLGVLLHLAGANSRGWLVLILLSGATAGILLYKRISPKKKGA